MADPIGQTVAGYPIEKPLGQGSYGIVYQARTAALPVALKLLREDLRTNARLNEAVAAGWEQARAVVHPNLVTVFAAGVDPRHGAYCIEELLKARSLRKIVIDGMKIAWRDVLEVAGQMAEGLGALHAAGLAHGDLWPSNVLVTLDQDVKLEGAGGLVRGKFPFAALLAGPALAYLSPERLQGAEAGPEADWYGMGASLYFLLAGVDPYSAQDPESLQRMVLEKDPKPLAALGVELPEAGREFIARLMAKEAGRRYSRAEQVLADLAALKNGQPLAPLPAAPNAPGEAPQALPDLEATLTILGSPAQSAPASALAPAPLPELEATLISKPAAAPAPAPMPELEATLISAPASVAPVVPSASPMQDVPSPVIASLSGLRAATASARTPVVRRPPSSAEHPAVPTAAGSGLRTTVRGAPASESKRYKAEGQAGVFGKLETQVGSTIPQSELERGADELFRHGQLAAAITQWMKAWEAGPQHAGLHAKIDLGNRELKRKVHETALQETRWALDEGRFEDAAKNAQEALNTAETDAQRTAAQHLAADAVTLGKRDVEKKALKKLLFVLAAVSVAVLALIVFLVLRGGSS